MTDRNPPPLDLPKGFLHIEELISSEEEALLMAEVASIAFESFEMHGQTARRRVKHYGHSYAYGSGEVKPSLPIPGFLEPLLQRVADWCQRPPEEFVEALLTEYPPGASIGWHRDAPAFGMVAGVSLAGDCELRLRPRAEPRRVQKLKLARRSAYCFKGSARWAWEHHIPAVASLRYSITFRTLRSRQPSGEDKA